jgi:hypothetical protein
MRQSFTVGTAETQSSLLFATKSRNTNRKRKPVPHDFGSQRLGSSHASTQSSGTQGTLMVSYIFNLLDSSLKRNLESQKTKTC